jgi:hypothetical protein
MIAEPVKPFKVSAGIRDLIATGNCVAFVGAGFSRPVGMPNWEGLLLQIVEAAEHFGKAAEVTKQCRACIDNREYALAAHLIRKELSDVDIRRVVTSAFDTEKLYRASEPARTTMMKRIKALCGSPWAGIITTNFDSLIEVGLREESERQVRVNLHADTRLGIALNTSSRDEMFFVKIHGSTDRSKVVLSAEEYEQAYLGNDKIRSFLSAAMLRFNLIFIGSSLEEHILLCRRELCADFRGDIPTAYALLPRSAENERRSAWLKEIARVEPVFYPDEHHNAVDDFLADASQIGVQRRLDEMPGSLRATEIRRLRSLDDRRQEVGEINRRIIDFVRNRCRGSVTKEQVLGLRADMVWPDQLGPMSGSERFYRVLFLISVGLMKEIPTHAETWYTVIE